MRHKDGKIYNNTVVIDKQGSVVASYSKVHLFGLFNEERFFAAGDNFDTYELNGVICGLLFVMICDFLNCTGIYHFREQK